MRPAFAQLWHARSPGLRSCNRCPTPRHLSLLWSLACAAVRNDFRQRLRSKSAACAFSLLTAECAVLREGPCSHPWLYRLETTASMVSLCGGGHFLRKQIDLFCRPSAGSLSITKRTTRRAMAILDRLMHLVLGSVWHLDDARSQESMRKLLRIPSLTGNLNSEALRRSHRALRV